MIVEMSKGNCLLSEVSTKIKKPENIILKVIKKHCDCGNVRIGDRSRRPMKLNKHNKRIPMQDA